VLHLLKDPKAALLEASRVSRLSTMALFFDRKVEGGNVNGGGEVREEIRKALVEMGHPIPPRPSPWEKDQALLKALPPDALTEVGDSFVSEPVKRRLEWMERRADRATLEIPDRVLQEAIKRVRNRIGDRIVSYRRTYYLASWLPGKLRTTLR
jgi:hypothetical protein